MVENEEARRLKKMWLDSSEASINETGAASVLATGNQTADDPLGMKAQAPQPPTRRERQHE